MPKKSISLTLMLMFLCHSAALAAGPSYGLRPQAVIERGKYTQKKQPDRSWGNATVAFRLMNSGILGREAKEDINIMLTYKCPFNCAHCLAIDARKEGKGRDAPKETLFSVFDELTGFKRAHIVGTGEVLAYGKENPLTTGASQDFIDVVKYAAERVEEVRITTNAYLVPEDLEEARKFFAQFPPNVVWLVSVDKFHAEQMERVVSKSLRRIVDTMEQLASQNIIRTAYNVRIETNEARMPILESFGLYRKFLADGGNIFINRVQSVGSAALHNLGGIPLRNDDIRRHGDDPAKLFLFIDPDGYVLTSDHMAYMTIAHKRHLEDHMEGLFILGNVNRRPLANIILERLFFFNMSRQTTGYFDAICDRLRPYYASILPWGSLATVDIKGSWEGIWQNVIKAIYFYSIGDIDGARKLMADFDNIAQPIKCAIADILYYFLIYNKHPELADIEDFVNQCISSDWMIQADIGLSFSSAFRVLNSQRPDYQILDSGIIGGPWGGIPKRWLRDGSYFCPVYEIRTSLGPFGGPRILRNISPLLNSKFITMGWVYGWYYRDAFRDGAVERTSLSLWQSEDDADGYTREYFRLLEIAKAGLTLYPIALLQDLRMGEYYYVEQSRNEIGYSSNMNGKVTSAFSRIAMSFGEGRDELKILAERAGRICSKT